MPFFENPRNNTISGRGGFKRTDLNDTGRTRPRLPCRYWDLSSGWQRAINLRWSFDHFTGETSYTTMLFCPGVMISRTAREVDASTGRFAALFGRLFGAGTGLRHVDFCSVLQAPASGFRTLYDRLRFCDAPIWAG